MQGGDNLGRLAVHSSKQCAVALCSRSQPHLKRRRSHVGHVLRWSVCSGCRLKCVSVVLFSGMIRSYLCRGPTLHAMFCNSDLECALIDYLLLV